MDLLTALPHDSWLHLNIAPLLISKLYKPLKQTLGLCCVFTSRSLLTASNSGDSSSAPTKSSLHRLPHNWLTSCLVITSRCGPRRKHRSLLYSKLFRWNVFAKALPSNGCVYLLNKNLLPSSECCYPGTGLHAIISTFVDRSGLRNPTWW
jgi:hypothetical protein